MHIKVLFFLVYPSSWIITIEAREINLWPMKVVGRRELGVCRRLKLLSVAHGLMLKMEVKKSLIQICEFGLEGDKFFFHLSICSCVGENNKNYYYYYYFWVGGEWVEKQKQRGF